ncbi:MAG: S8 family peptidase [Lachnospiraceae bacterium]|nr:S8 family peptidase [Lachnospiraceae bacterium]
MEKLTGKGVGIAFLDTGIFPHMDFGSRIMFFGDFVNRRLQMYDDNGHGTHTAGIACGDGKASQGRVTGIASGAHIIALKVLDRMGNGRKEQVTMALQWVLHNHRQYAIRIVNISVGAAHADEKLQDTLIQAVEEVWDAGLTVITAAGNLGPGKGSVTAPGSSRKVITVGSADLITSAFPISGRGPTSACVCKPDIVMTGAGVLSCANEQGQYSRKSGTSMSTAKVSGAAALLLEKYPGMDNLTVKKKILDAGEDLGLPRNLQGRGSLKLDQLLK